MSNILRHYKRHSQKRIEKPIEETEKHESTVEQGLFTKHSMIYQCEHCGCTFMMWLQIGLEEHGENHKPVPYTIGCPKCRHFARHVYWDLDEYLSESMPITREMNYFANRKDCDCGVPVYAKN